jgi:formamidopyrimidine-DNA glycosylase
MPELPEVETICRYLRDGTSTSPSILGFVIDNVQVFWTSTLATPGVEEFSRRLPGQAITKITRRGKFVILRLTTDSLLIHLRMSGDLLVEAREVTPALHHRLLINFQNGMRLSFNDTRKFGRIWLVDEPQQVTGDLGPEPLAADFTADQLYQRLKSTRRQLKPLLLDQSFLAGLGNIYVDESLNLARLHPLESSQEITEQQTVRLWNSIRQVLNEAILRNGASIDWVYRGGDFQNYFRAYGREGQPCLECGTPIQRIKVGQRGTHFCPQCQQLSTK